MDELSSAIRLFQQILPEPAQLLDSVTLRKLRVWLRDDVGRVVDALARRPTFREHAAWCIQALRSDSDTDERGVIDALEAAYWDAGKAYIKLLNNKSVLAQAKLSSPPRSHTSRETLQIQADGKPRVLNAERQLIDEFALELSQLQTNFKLGRKSLTLINVEDYFEPQQEFVQAQAGRLVQVGALVVGITPELHPVGNFILQCAVQRIEEFLTLLTAIRGTGNKAVRAVGRIYREQEVADLAWNHLQVQVMRFRRTMQSGPEADVRNACIILTQVYAAFHPAPDLAWLGLPEHLCHHGRAAVMQRVRGSRGGELFERVAGALIEARRLYEDSNSPLSAREEAIARGDLVLIAKEHVLYWNCEQISFATVKCRATWEMLLPLITKARSGSYITEGDVFGEEIPARSGMAMRMQRLKTQLPSGLRKLIEPGPEPRTYQLVFERQRIHLH